MTTNFKFVADMAALAEASYANLIDSSAASVMASLQDAGFLGKPFSETQAADFVQHWSVVAGGHQPNTASGFSATLFQGNAGSGDFAGQYVLAIRGTEEPGLDLAYADGGDIVLDGLAVDQIIDLYNYTQKLTHAGTYQAAKLTRVTVPATSLPEDYAKAHGLLFLKGYNGGDGAGVYRVDTETRTDGTDLLPAGVAVHITGHSLGGHLAAAFSRLFPSLTLDATMINGAGFADGFSLISSSFNVANLFQALDGSSSFDANKITNYIGTAAMDFVSQDWFISLEQPGATQHVTTESFSRTNTVGHGAGQMTNTLAIMSLLGQLDQTGTLTVPEINGLMDKAANQSDETFERLVNDLSRIFDIPIITDVNANSTTVGREALFTNIIAIQNSDLFKALVGKVKIVASPASATEAREDFSAFLSLFYLTPFTLKANNAEANNLLLGIHQSLGNHWTDDYNLSDAAKQNGQTYFSDKWLADRAQFLQVIIEGNKQDRERYVYVPGSNAYFKDLTTGIIFDTGNNRTSETTRDNYIFGSIDNNDITGGNKNDHLYGMDGNDTINGGLGNDYLEGNDGQDNLKGNEGDDVLVGGGDVDILDGGEGNDQLKGGAGVDVYQFVGNFGTDVITDSDGQGFITIDNLPINSANLVAEGIYQQNPAAYRYTKVNGGDTLIISKADDTNRIIIKDWSATKNLGINLTGDLAPPPEATLVGDFKKKIDDQGTADGTDDVYVMTDGNYTRDETALNGEPGAADLISGVDTPETNSKDVIYGLGGDDALSGKNGDDYIDGGSGTDILQGGLGKDTLLGGAGDDAIYGASDMDLSKPVSVNFTSPINSYAYPQGTGFNWTKGYDTTFANGVPHGFSNAARNRLADDQGNIIDGGDGDDFIAAGTGADYVHGGADKDYIFGMDKDDILFGDGGNDIIYGDGDKESTDSVVWTRPEDHGRDIIDGGDGVDILYGQGQDDIIFGGNGNDEIWGDDQDTLSSSPVGNDYLEGGAGNDTLHGGAGKDIYVYNKGDGVDTVYDDLTAGENTFRFGAGINADSIKLRKGSLLLDFGNGDAIHIEGFDTQDALNSVAISNFEFADGTVLTSTDLLSRGFDLDGSSGDDSITGTNITDRINGFAGDDTIIGELGQDTLSGGDGNDVLAGDRGDADADGGDADFLDGGDGDDALFGQGGHDTLRGGAGADQMQGGVGNDVYQLNLGDGQDIVIDASGDNTIVFGTGITIDSVRAVYNSVDGHLVLQYGDRGDQISLYMNGETFDQGLSGNIIQSYQFADGSVLSHAQLMQITLPSLNYMGTSEDDTVISGGWADTLSGGNGDDALIGQGGNDSLAGGMGNDTLDGDAGDDILSGGLNDDILYGGSGNDYLSGDVGDDTLVGGTGDDTLSGGFGNDTYQISRGSGQDKLIEINSSNSFDRLAFDADILPADVSYYRLENGDLQLRILDSSDTVTISGWFKTATPPMESIVYGDGTEITGAALLALPIAPIHGTLGDDALVGTDYDDTLIALDGNDTLDGGAGIDTLSGGEGQDVYRLRQGMGTDSVIETSDGANIIELDQDLSFNVITTAREGNDLLLNIRGTNDGLLLKDYYLTTSDWSVKDSAGTTLALSELALAQEGQDSDFYNTIRNDYFSYVKSDIQDYYSSAGYQIMANGNLLSSWENHNANVSQYIDNLYQTITTTYNINGNSSTQVHNYSSTGGWVSYPDLYSDTVLMRHETLVSDAAQIDDNPFSQWTYSQNIQYIRATVAWGADYNVSETSDSYTTISIMNDGQGVMVGTVTSENAQRRYQAYRTGLVVAIEPSGPDPLNDDQVSGRLIDDYRTLSQLEVIAGISNNNIQIHNYLSVINGGAGDDTIQGGGLQYGGTGNDLLIDGGRMYGGEGNDTLIGGAVMSTSAGFDTVYTNQDESVIFIDPLSTTNALIGGDGAGYSLPFLDAVYESMDINNWQERYSSGGYYHLIIPGEISSYDGTLDKIGDPETLLASVHQWVDPTMPWQQVVARGLAYYIEPLPKIADCPDLSRSDYYEDSNTPAIHFSANDYAGLADFYERGSIPSHLITFGEGIAVPDLEFSWSQVNASISWNGTKTLHAALNISWGSDQQIQVMIPHADDPIGSGISTFEFADSQSLTIAEMIALAPAAPSFDPNIYHAELGMGIQHVPEGIDRIQFGTGITSDMITLGLGSLMLRVGTNGDELHIDNFDPSNALDSPVWSFNFSDGSSLDYDELVARGFDIYGTANDEALTGTNLDNRIHGGGGNDTLIGSGNSDTLIGGAGAVTMIGGLGNETFVIDGLDDVIIANPDAASNSILSSISYVLPEHIDNITLTGSDNLTATGNELNNVITGNAGNDTLIANGGDDILISGTGIDTLIGNAGNNTFIVNDADDIVIADMNAISNSIYSSVSYVLPEYVQNLMLTGDADLIATGNALDNILIGNGGDHILIGKEGNDTLVAGTGGATLIGGAGSDTFVLSQGGGQQTIIDNADIEGNVIEFGPDVTAGTIQIFDQGTDILIRYGTESDSVLIKDFFSGNGQANSQFRFSDGTQGEYVREESGNLTLNAYDANGRLVADFWRNIDGSYGNNTYNPNGSISSGTSYQADGAYSVTTVGWNETTTINFDANGRKLSDSWTQSNGKSGSNFYYLDGSSSGTLHFGNGDYETYTDNGTGNTTRLSFTASDFMWKEAWTKADGSEGYGIYDTDGSAEVFVNDGKNNTTLTNYDASGNKVGDSFTKADGSYGEDVFYEDGSTEGFIYYPDGSYSEYFDDGVGNTYRDYYDATDNLSSSVWTEADGTSGSDIFNADGSYISIVDDGLGTITTSTYDADDNKLSAHWTKVDGTYGDDMFNSDGSSSGTIYRTDGTYSSYTDDGAGNVHITNYDADGNELLVSYPLSDQLTIEDDSFSYVIPTGSFGDGSESLYYTATLKDGSSLPEWLNFDASALTFSGVPDNDVVGSLEILVRVTDQSGRVATQSFILNIENVNDDPSPQQDAYTTDEDSPLTIQAANLLDNDFDIDPTHDELSVVGVGNAVNGFVTMEENGNIQFVSSPDYVGPASFDYTVTDTHGGLATATVNIDVKATNDAPIVLAPLEDQYAVEDAAFGFSLPDGLFQDIDQEDVLSYKVTMSNGEALPPWLQFDPTTHILSGTPGNSDVGSLNLMVTATDIAGASVSTSFDLAIANTNDAPVTVADTATAREDQLLEATGNVLTNDSDIDIGTTLHIADEGVRQGIYGSLMIDVDGSYRYELDNAAAQSLGNSESFVERFTYAASDGNVFTTGELAIRVYGENDAPLQTSSFATVDITAGSSFYWNLPATAFADADIHDTLSYAVTLESGAALPSWLNFDPDTQRLTGTPDNDAAGTLRLSITASDGHSSTSGLLELGISAIPQGITVIGTTSPDILRGTSYDDILDGRDGLDTLIGGAGDDLYIIDANHPGAGRNDPDWPARQQHGRSTAFDHVLESANSGFDTVWSTTDYVLPNHVESLVLRGEHDLQGYGNTLNNLLVGNIGNNRLDGKSGNDLLLGNDGNDRLIGGKGLDALDGGNGNDVLEDGAGTGFVAGGKGNDILRLDKGNDIIAFNRGDGQDLIESGDGLNDVLSLSGGIQIADLRLSKQGRDLILATGGQDTIRFSDWYKSGEHQTVAVLQVATINGDSPSGARYEFFNFDGLVSEFDSARAANKKLDSWAVSDAAPDYKLGTSDTEIFGGALASAYAKEGSIEDVAPELIGEALATSKASATPPVSEIPQVPPPSGGSAETPTACESEKSHQHSSLWGTDDNNQHTKSDGFKDWITPDHLAHLREETRPNGYEDTPERPINDQRTDYAVSWAYLRDKLAGRLYDESGAPDWKPSIAAHDPLGTGISMHNIPGQSRISASGNLLKPFEGLKEGFDRLHL